MVSHFIYKCTLFLACRWRHFFSIFARVHRSRDVSFLCIFTLPFRICFLEFWKRQSWTVLKIAIQLSLTTFLQPERLLSQKLSKQNRQRTINWNKDTHLQVQRESFMGGPASSSVLQEGLVGCKQRPGIGTCWRFGGRRRADSTMQSGSCRGRHGHQTDLPLKSPWGSCRGFSSANCGSFSRFTAVSFFIREVCLLHLQ